MPVLAVSVLLQLIFSGGMIDMTGRAGLDQFSLLMPSRWAFAMGASTVDLEKYNPSKPDDWMWNHEPMLWFFLSLILMVYAAAAIWGTLKLLQRQKSAA